MIARYAIKKLLILITIFVSIFGSLQLNFVQHKLLNLLNGSEFQIQFNRTTGFFPFSFSAYDFSIKTNDIQIGVNRLKISFNERMFHVKHFEIDKVKVIPLTKTKLCPSDFKVLIPIIMQRSVKAAKINELDIAGEKINDIILKYNRKLNNTILSFTSSIGKLSAQWKLDGAVISGIAKLGNYGVTVSFDRASNELRLSALNAILEGTICDKFFTGTLKYAGYEPDIKIWTKNEFIIAKFNEKTMNISGSLEYNLDKLTAKIYNVKCGKHTNVSPIEIEKSLKVSDFSIMLPKGQMDFHGVDFSSGNFSLEKLSVNKVDISQIEPLKNMKGIINGTGAYNQAIKKLDLIVSNFDYIGISIPKIDITSTCSDDQIASTVKFEILKKLQQIDIKLNPKAWSLNCMANGFVDIQDLKIASGQRVRGKLKYQIKVTGSTDKPSLAGDISIKDGVYVNLLSGTYIRDVTFLSKFQNDTFDITKIYARDDSKIGGRISGKGKIRYTNGKLDTNIGVKIDKFKVVDQKWLNARLFGNLTLVGDLMREVKVKGDLYTEKPSIDVSGIVLLSMRSTDLIAKKKPQSQTKLPLKVKFPTDITLTINPELKVSGFGLDSSWDAGAKVRGDLMTPKYELGAKLKSGEIELTDNIFKLKNGDVLINNADTNISVSAEKIINKIVVGAKFTQKAGQSKVDLYSNPYMSDKDVISYMLFDKNASEISMGEAMSLLGVMTKLSGGADFNILGRMKTIFGIDSISMKKNKNASGEEYDTVSLGKKIGKFKVSVEQATGKDGTNVVVEADVAKNTKVSVDLSSKDSFGGGILWSKRY